MSITLSTHDAFLSALEAAHAVSLSSYAISYDIANELEACAKRGGEVRVQLAAHPVGDADGKRAAAVARMVRQLRDSGVDASLAAPGGTAPHAKAAVIDGVLWLDDRNFPRTGPDLVLRDDMPADVAAATSWMNGTLVRSDRIAFTKNDALQQEAAMIAAAPRGEIDISTEDIGTGPVEFALAQRLAGGDHVRVLADLSECTTPSALNALDILRSAGAEVRSRRSVDKLAITGNQAWLGSANATYPGAQTATQSDWGLVTSATATVDDLRRRFDQAWGSP